MFATPARDGFDSLKPLFVRGAHPSVVICVSVHLNKVIPPPSIPRFSAPRNALVLALFSFVMRGTQTVICLGLSFKVDRGHDSSLL